MAENKISAGASAPGSGLTAEQLIQQLPEDVRPVKTAKSYPHIIDKLAELWRTPTAVLQFFDGLLIDNRGGRQGFSLSVIFEIQSLKDHYQEHHAPKASSTGVWSEASELEKKTRLERGG